MKKTFLFFFIFSSLFSQEKQKKTKGNYNIQFDYLYANIVSNNEIKHLITDTTEGFLLSWNKETYGEKKWQQRFNYPDIGFSFGYLNFKNKSLDKAYSIYAHYNFYLSNREAKNKFVLGVGTGLAYTTNPFNKENNHKNLAIGSHLNTTSFLKFSYARDEILQNIGLYAGASFVHISNGSTAAPNKGINALGVNLGINYRLHNTTKKYITYSEPKTTTKERIHLNISFLFGANEPIVDIGLHPFIIVSGYLDKRLTKKHTIQLGTELSLHQSIKELIEFDAIFNKDATDIDWKRVSIFVGHELLFNKTAIITQLGFYAYSPYKENGIVYERLGLKRYIKNSYFASISVKAHIFKAEGLEFGIGYRF